jgi:phospholipid/cholesterol/gamma-HCH transport system permease protein
MTGTDRAASGGRRPPRRRLERLVETGIGMGDAALLQLDPVRWSLSPVRWLMGWWTVALFAAQMLVLMLSPSSYRSSQRPAIYLQLHACAAPLLPGFVALSALLSLVIIRIVIASAAAYGLSQYALVVLVRTLVLELLPLFVALYVALRFTMPSGEQVAEMRQQGVLHALWRSGGDPARDLLLPRVLAGVFSVVFLAALSAVLSLVMTYVSLYGFTTWGFAAYTRDVGQVFTPAATLILGLKAFFFSLVVAILPIAPNPRFNGAALRRRDEIGQLGRLFALILLIEVASLVGNYY